MCSGHVAYSATCTFKSFLRCISVHSLYVHVCMYTPIFDGICVIHDGPQFYVHVCFYIFLAGMLKLLCDMLSPMPECRLFANVLLIDTCMHRDALPINFGTRSMLP